MPSGDTRTKAPDIPIEPFLANLPLFGDLLAEEIGREAAGLVVHAGSLLTVPDRGRLHAHVG